MITAAVRRPCGQFMLSPRPQLHVARFDVGQTKALGSYSVKRKKQDDTIRVPVMRQRLSRLQVYLDALHRRDTFVFSGGD